MKSTEKKGTKIMPFDWDSSHQVAFDLIKTRIAHDVVLAYPNFEEEVEIYTDASTRQLAAVIVQQNRPIAFSSRKLFGTQQEYFITDLKLLSIVETLKEFRGMLWDQKIIVYKDH